MTKRNLHIRPIGNGWGIYPAGSYEFIVLTDKQSEAIEYAKGLAKKRRVQLIIHRRNGRVRQRNDYSA